MDWRPILHHPTVWTGNVGEFADRIGTDLAAKLNVVTPGSARIVPGLIVGEVVGSSVAGLDVCGPGPAIAAPAKHFDLSFGNAVMGGDLARGVQGGYAAAKYRPAIGDLPFNTGIDARKISDGRDITRLAKERKVATLIEQPMNVHEWSRRPVAGLRARFDLLRGGTDLCLSQHRVCG